MVSLPSAPVIVMANPLGAARAAAVDAQREQRAAL